MAVASNQVAGFEAWQIQSLRLTILLNPAPVQAEQNWWERIIGTPPDQVASQPRQALHSEQGSFHNHSLNLRLQPGKIDWTLTAPMTAEVFENIPAIGSFEAAVDIFRPVAHEWLNICPSFHRLALGMNLFQPAPNKIAAYERIQQYLPDVRLDIRSSDFFYQINRVRNSRTAVQNLRINRLMKWNVLQLIVELQPLAVVTAQPASERFACALELDINTTVDRQGDLARNDYEGIFNELLELSREIARCGDIP